MLQRRFRTAGSRHEGCGPPPYNLHCRPDSFLTSHPCPPRARWCSGDPWRRDCGWICASAPHVSLPKRRMAMRGLGLPPGASATKTPWCGTGIRPLQTMLKDLDLYAGAIDGSAGTGTNNAIVAAQRQFGLPTGQITKAFCGALAAAWEARMAPAPAPAAPGPSNGGEASFNPETGPTTPGEPGGAMVQSNGGIMAKWDALPPAGKVGVVGGGVLLIGGVGYAIYAMTR